jgi:hypothetical protein
LVAFTAQHGEAAEAKIRASSSLTFRGAQAARLPTKNPHKSDHFILPLYPFRSYSAAQEDDMNETKETKAAEIGITETSLKVFTAYAKDAGNWSGQPLIGGNVGGSKEERGNLTQLKKAGLITTFRSDGLDWMSFTDKGKELAASMGINIFD